MSVTISNTTNRCNTAPSARGRMSRRLAVLLGSVAVSALFPTGAFAQCASTSPNEYLCENPIGPQSITGPSVRVDTAPGFSITGPATSLSINSTTGGAIYNDENASSLTATGAGNDALRVTVDAGGTLLAVDTNGVLSGENGIVTVNNGTGSHTVIVQNNVTGTGGTGISATSADSVTQLSVIASNANGTVTGATTGILMDNHGIGLTILSSLGTVVGQSGSGIRVRDEPSAQNMIITTATTNGGQHGIDAMHAGTGGLSVTATGTTTGGTGAGIRAIGDGAGTDVIVNAAAASGVDGVVANNNGHGKTQVTTTGDVIGTDGIGIVAASGSPTTDLSVNAANVTGATTGIYAFNAGSGTTGVKASGIVTGTTDDGIYVEDAAIGKAMTIEVAATNGGGHGIYAAHVGTDNLSVTATGDVSGMGGSGIRASTGNGAKDLTILAGNATGSLNGVAALGGGTGKTQVTTTGNVIGGGNIGILAGGGSLSTDVGVNANNVTGANVGIYVINEGTGTSEVKASGTVTGTNRDGIRAEDTAAAKDMTIEAASTNGGRYGIIALHTGTGNLSVTATGTTTGGTDRGIFAQGDAAGTDVTVAAAAVSGFEGVVALNNGQGKTQVATTGAVTGTGDKGIYVEDATTAKDMTVDAATTTGKVTGIHAVHNGTGNLTVTATGTTTALNARGIYARGGAAGTDLTVNAAAVSGAVGIDAINSGTGNTSITTTGDVRGTAASGISGGNLAAAKNLSVHAVNVSGTTGITVGNSGTGTTEVKATGIVTGRSNDGIFARDDVTSKDMTIETATTTGAEYGINAEHSGTGNLTVTATGTTTGGTNLGIFAQGDAAGTDVIVNAAAVSGTTGIFALNNGIGATSVTATGGVTGTAGDGIAASNGGTATDLSVTAAGVTGSNNGIVVNNLGTGNTHMTATGDVTGTTARGVDVTGAASTGDTIVRVGNTSGATGALRVTGKGTGRTVVDSTGTATAGTGPVTSGVGVRVENGANSADMIVNVNSAIGANGVVVISNGLGTTNLTVTGDTTGTGFDGIFASNAGPDTKDLTVVHSGTTTGKRFGLLAQSSGAGSNVIVTSTGTAKGGTMDMNAAGEAGIRVGAFGPAANIDVTANNSLGLRGIDARNFGVGTTSITTNGTTTGIQEGIFVTAEATAKSVSVITNGAVTGGTTGIDVANAGAGTTSIKANSDVVGTTQRGISVAASGPLGTGVSIDSAKVTGETDGINVLNDSNGATSVVARGDVTGISRNGIGINASAVANTTDASVRAGKVTGGLNGIVVRNRGTGATSVTATDDVTGTSGNGIDITAGQLVGGVAARGTNLDVNVAKVTGGVTGIQFNHSGTGNTTITTTGDVVGGTGDGISGFTAIGSGSLTVTAAKTTGGADGIDVRHGGIGVMTVTANGDAKGTSGSGVRVGAGSTTTDMIVTVGNTSGNAAGLDVSHSGTGRTIVNSTGTASGVTFVGINVSATGNSGDVTINANKATGASGVQFFGTGKGAVVMTVTGDTNGTRSDGIYASNAGANGKDVTIVNSGNATGARFGIFGASAGAGAKTMITSTGDAIGGGAVDQAGIRGTSGAAANGVTIIATNASGYRGIDAETRGTGTTNVVVSGTAIGVAEGIFVETLAPAGAVSITANNARGGTAGIGIDNAGTDNAAVTVNGLVEGGTAGIVATTSTARAVTITNAGTIRNTSGLTSDRAATISGGAARIINNNIFTGTVLLGSGDDIFDNNGTWNSIGGVNDFGGGSDRLSNTSNTTLVGGINAAVAETTTFNNLELLTNSGTISMRDGGVGDRIVTDGAVILQAGSTLAIDVGAGNTTDLLAAGGAATIQSGANLVVNGLVPGAVGDRHTFLTAAGGLTGTFNIADSYTSAFLGFRDGYTASSAYIEFAQLRALAAAGVTPNQIATANGVESLAPGNPIRAAALGLINDAQAQTAFDGLSGEIHPTVRTVMAEDTRLPRNAVLERLSADRGGAIWGQSFGNWGDSDGDRNVADVDRKTYGFLAGADFGASEDGIIMGVAVGYLDTDASLRARASKASIKTIHGLAYIGAHAGDLSIKAGFGYAKADIDTRRSVAVGSFANTLTDSYKGNMWQGFAEAGYRIPLGGGYVEPFVGINGVRAHSNAVGEAGGAAAVFAAAKSENSIASTTGVRFETAPARALSFVGTIGWQHGFGRLGPVNANALSGSNPFLIGGAPQSRDAGIATVSARYRITPMIDLTVGYDGVLGTAAQDHAAKATLRVKF